MDRELWGFMKSILEWIGAILSTIIGMYAMGCITIFLLRHISRFFL